MKILGIETSCDETAAAVVEGGRHILSNVVASQVDLHARYGGVVPEVASRQHLLAGVPVVRQALAGAGVAPGDLAAVAVTVGPGLPGSLLVGVSLAKALALAWGLPLVGINHLEAHLYANWLAPGDLPTFPLLALIVSGGHTHLLLAQGHGQYQALGQTRDDAAGEAFDKVARILGLGYPGGPAIDAAAREGRDAYPLPRPWLRGSYDFSFSGLKTAVLRLAIKEGLDRPQGPPPHPRARDLAASFQRAVVEVLVGKTVQAARRHRARQVLLAGGVAANRELRRALAAASPLPVLVPPPALCTDNAAMVAACAFYKLPLPPGQEDGLGLDVQPGLRLP